MYDNPDYYMPLVEKLSVLSLHAPMLKERREDIASIAMLYINEYNREFSKQVVGLEPKALTLLENFSWPNNVDQLKKTICQAMLLTDTPHITAATISSIIQSLDSTDEPEQVTTAIHLGGTLDEITRQVISLVLAEEEMNQSRAAARLGISRTTMWRKLNEK